MHLRMLTLWPWSSRSSAAIDQASLAVVHLDGPPIRAVPLAVGSPCRRNGPVVPVLPPISPSLFVFLVYGFGPASPFANWFVAPTPGGGGDGGGLVLVQFRFLQWLGHTFYRITTFPKDVLQTALQQRLLFFQRWRLLKENIPLQSPVVGGNLTQFPPTQLGEILTSQGNTTQSRGILPSPTQPSRPRDIQQKASPAGGGLPLCQFSDLCQHGPQFRPWPLWHFLAHLSFGKRGRAKTFERNCAIKEGRVSATLAWHSANLMSL